MPEPRPLAAVLTLGCKLNLADSETIARGLRAAGYDVVDALCEADAIVVNTCSVTHVADQKSRRLVRAARRAAPRAAIAVTGCYPQSADPGDVAALGADLVASTRAGDQEALIAALAARVLPAGAGDDRRRPGPPGLRTRAFIRAQSGCNDVCAFCIVPRTRGREVSRLPADVARDVNEAAAAGAREAVITGTQLGAWGRDFDPPLRPHHLIAHLLETTDIPRIRFSSLQPQDITPELLALWGDPRLMPHFHLALQAGSDAVLAAMRRRYTLEQFRDAAARIRAAVPGAAITTDVIAGFPGESDEEFEATLAVCRAVAFARIHAFPYSRRARTAAARMPGQVPDAVRRERMARLLALAAELDAAHRAAAAGSVQPVLWEASRMVEGERLWTGHTPGYITVYAPGEGLANRITPVRLGPLLHDGVRGELRESAAP
jgi:threonylcarbamoyladenosine tRNA methylthiotransferase MtaB